MDKSNQISITDACELVGISRSTFYTRYLQTGLISKSKENNKVFIDMSELARVFPNIKIQSPDKDNDFETLRLQKTMLEQEVHYLKNEIEQLKINAERNYQREQNLQSTIQIWKLMIENRTSQDKDKKSKKSAKQNKKHFTKKGKKKK